MKSPEPSVSVIVLTHNRIRLLRDTVRTLTEQSYPRDRLEIIVVNDGSSDGTRAWLDQEATPHGRIRAVHQDKLGISAARNTGILAARGDLIAIVADDYLLAPDYVSTFVRFFQQHPGARVVRFGIVASDRWPGSLVSHFYYEVSFKKRLHSRSYSDEISLREKIRMYLRKDTTPPEKISTDHELEASGAAAFRREVFDSIGLFDEDLKRAEDTDMSIRLRKDGIPIWYYPFHKIRHRYGRWGGDTIKKNFLSGFYAARLHDKLKCRNDRSASGGKGLAHRFLSLLLRIRQTVHPLAGLLLIPWIVIFETAWIAGYLFGKSQARPSKRKRATSHSHNRPA